MVKKSSELKLTAATNTATPVKATTATTAATKPSKATAVAKKLPQSKDNSKTIPLPSRLPSLINSKTTSTIAKTMQASSKILSQAPTAATPPSLKTINSVKHDLNFPLLTVTVQNDRPRLIKASTVMEKSTEKRLPIEQMVKPNELTSTKKVLLKNTSLKNVSSEDHTVELTSNIIKRPETSVDVVKEIQSDPSIDINEKPMLKLEDELLAKSDITGSADLFHKSELEKMDLLKSSERKYSEHRYVLSIFKKVVLFPSFNTILGLQFKISVRFGNNVPIGVFDTARSRKGTKFRGASRRITWPTKIGRRTIFTTENNYTQFVSQYC